MTNETNNLKLTGGYGDEPDAPFDPKLEALLDEALAPDAIEGGIPHDLAARVFNATHGKLQKRRTILGRIGPGSRFSIAASWGIAALLAVTFSMIPPSVNAFSELRRDLQALNQYKGPNEQVDQELVGLAIQIDQAAAHSDAPYANDAEVNFAVENASASMIF